MTFKSMTMDEFREIFAAHGHTIEKIRAQQALRAAALAIEAEWEHDPFNAPMEVIHERAEVKAE